MNLSLAELPKQRTFHEPRGEHADAETTHLLAAGTGAGAGAGSSSTLAGGLGWGLTFSCWKVWVACAANAALSGEKAATTEAA